MNAKKVNWLFVAIFFMYHAVSYGLIYYITHIHMIGLIPLTMASELIFIIPGVIFVFATRTKWRDMLKLKPIRISTVLIVILFTFLCMPLVTVVNLATQFFVENAVEASSTMFLLMPFGVTFFIVAIYAPVCEEIVFRGITYESLKKDMSVFKAMIISAVFFGLAHMNFNQAAYALLLGLILVLVREATGSLWATILIHVVFNGWNVILMYASEWMIEMFPDLAGDATSLVQTAAERNATLSRLLGIYLIIAAVTTTLAGCVLVWMAGREGRKEELRNIWRCRKEGKKNGLSWLIPYILVLALFLGYMLYDVLV